MSPFLEAPNVNALHGALIVEELVRLGVRRFFLSPGSRSSPLVVAAAKNERADVTIRVDERGAAFHALGAARGSGLPSVVITTSGTAVANLYPAVVEASMDGVPLIVLTADRPPELHGVGANQSIPQHEMFGDFVRSFVSLDPPDASYAPLDALNHVDEAHRAAVGPRAGPVQVNVQLREPLAPTEAAWDRTILDPLEGWMSADAPLTTPSVPIAPQEDTVEQDVLQAIRSAERGLLVLGTLDEAAHDATVGLADKLGWAIHADLRSGYRLGTPASLFLPHLDWLFDDAPATLKPDVILQLGGRLTSKRLVRQLERGEHTHYVLVDDAVDGTDPSHNVTSHVRATVADAIRQMRKLLSNYESTPVPDAWIAANEKVGALLGAALDAPHALSEPVVARYLSRAIDPDHGLFIGNSMPIRDIQTFAATDGPRVPVAANRGASGIDGLVSSAIGFAEGRESPATLLIGDLSLLHDLNGLGCLAHASQPLTIVVINNGGGGIFAFLPIADHEDVFDPYFTTPHDLTFEHIANAFGLRYFASATPAELAEGYRTAIAFGERALIEVSSEVMENRNRHEELAEAVRKTLEPLQS